VIGHFVFSSSPDPNSIAVEMRWGSSNERIGSVLVPETMPALYAELINPSLLRDLALPGALTYGLFIAIKTDHPFVLTGDHSVWNSTWGALVTEGMELT
jgi:hypothetical protein